MVQASVPVQFGCPSADARASVKATADGLLATFDAPGQAIRCAAAILDQAGALGVQLRAGIHTGEVERLGDLRP